MYTTIAESNNFIVLDKYTKYLVVNEAPATYQTEAALEKIIELRKKQYEYYRDLLLTFKQQNV